MWPRAAARSPDSLEYHRLGRPRHGQEFVAGLDLVRRARPLYRDATVLPQLGDGQHGDGLAVFFEQDVAVDLDTLLVAGVDRDLPVLDLPDLDLDGRISVMAVQVSEDA